MAFTIHSDERHKWIYAPETTWGTAIAMSATSFKDLVLEKATFPSLGVSFDQLPNNRVSRVQSLLDHFTDNFTGPFDVQFSTLLTRDRAADLLYGVMQNRVSQGLVGTGYQKVYRPHASQPDFTANAGYFFTLAWIPADYATTSSVRYTSCIIKNLTLEFTKEGAGISNIVRASGTITAKKVEINQNYTGTSAAIDTSLYIRPYEFSSGLTLTLTASGGDVEFSPNWRTFSLTIDNGAAPTDKDTSGNPVTFFLMPSLTASIGLYYDSNTVAAAYTLRQGAIVPFTLTKGTTDNAGYFNITGKGKITNDPWSAGSNQMHVPIELQLGNSTAVATDALTVTISDAISQ